MEVSHVFADYLGDYDAALRILGLERRDFHSAQLLCQQEAYRLLTTSRRPTVDCFQQAPADELADNLIGPGFSKTAEAFSVVKEIAKESLVEEEKVASLYTKLLNLYLEQ
ncbi:unnamed protein product [Protopolystoma xenopodis]|uniref:Uncharacterized protein n=1 Tax=Protopolystoma xenopodis TaxID=117903 RepID=A0A3S5FEN2_9PLAT|nr:unnamed protein product [Protopolystoma xenopodis]